MDKYICTVCGYIFDENEGLMWDSLSEDWLCPLCGAGKSAFEIQKDSVTTKVNSSLVLDEASRSLDEIEYSALCSNLAKACEKQYLLEEAEEFKKLASYFEGKVMAADDNSIEVMLDDIKYEIDVTFKNSNEVVDTVTNRGSKRALVWSEKVTRMLKSILSTYQQEGDSYLENKNVYVCEICGFLYIGEEKPHVCPVCKVPNFKMKEIGRD